MQGKQLKEAIAILYDMELNNYMMTRSIQQLEQEAVNMGQERRFIPPSKQFNDVSIAAHIKRSVPFAIISGVLALIIYTVSPESFFAYFMMSFVFGSILTGLAIGLTKKKKRQNEIEQMYNNDMQAYNNALNNDKIRIQNEILSAKALRVQENELDKRRYNATKELDKFYDVVGIDPLFRNLVPIGYMNDLIRLGVSDTLEGPNGLNYLVRQDLRADEFHHTLEEISAKMDVLINAQRAMYHELQSVNAKCSRLVSESIKQTQIAINNKKTLEDIRYNTAISAYNSERIRKENEYANTLRTLEFYSNQTT